MHHTLQDFRRYVEREQNKRRGAFFYNFEPDEGALFVDEMRYLTEDMDWNPEVSHAFMSSPNLDHTVRLPDQLTDDQLIRYLELRADFLRGDFRREDEYYGRLYLLELAQTNIPAMFRFWDIMREEVRDKSYMIELCESCLIAHPEDALQLQAYQRARGLLPGQNVWEEIRSGNYDRATLYVREQARLLKQEEMYGEQNYRLHAWRAMPEIFYTLEESDRFHGYVRDIQANSVGNLRQKDSEPKDLTHSNISERDKGKNRREIPFRELISAGKEKRIYLNLWPVQGIQTQSRDQIRSGDGITYYKEKAYGQAHRWYRQEWQLYASTGDLLYAIYVYAESYMRERFGGPGRSRSMTRILKKNYRRSEDPPRQIRAMKALLQDSTFDKAIETGVENYLTDHPQILQDWQRSQREQKERKKRTQAVRRAASGRKKREEVKSRQKQIIYDMDHEQPDLSRKIDKDRLKQARKDMDSILGMLQEGDFYGR